MKKTATGILFGSIAGLIDVIPMFMMNLSWDAIISAFTMWVIVGFLIASILLNINSVLKGIIVAFLGLTPTAVLIGWKEPASLIPIFIMTTFLGGLLGFIIHKTTK